MDSIRRFAAFSGGGDRGAFGVGVAHHISQMLPEKNYDGYCGTSVGAVIAAFLSQYENFGEGADELLAYWKTVTRRSVYYKKFLGILNGLWSTGIFNTEPFLENIYQVFDPKRTVGAGKELRVVSVDLLTGEKVVGHQFSPDIRRHVLASASFPLAFPAVPLEENGIKYELVDGGIREIVPLSTAIKAGATHVDVIMMGRPHDLVEHSPGDYKNVLDVGMRLFDIMVNEIWVDDLITCHRINQEVWEGSAEFGKKYIEVDIWLPSERLESDTLGFDEAKRDELLEKGYFPKKYSLSEFVELVRK